jgi:hypothetical protein
VSPLWQRQNLERQIDYRQPGCARRCKHYSLNHARRCILIISMLPGNHRSGAHETSAMRSDDNLSRSTASTSRCKADRKHRKAFPAMNYCSHVLFQAGQQAARRGARWDPRVSDARRPRRPSASTRFPEVPVRSSAPSVSLLGRNTRQHHLSCAYVLQNYVPWDPALCTDSRASLVSRPRASGPRVRCKLRGPEAAYDITIRPWATKLARLGWMTSRATQSSRVSDHAARVAVFNCLAARKCAAPHRQAHLPFCQLLHLPSCPILLTEGSGCPQRLTSPGYLSARFLQLT